MESCHNNGVRSDCRLENLRYDTAVANAADRVRHGTALQGQRHHQASLTDEQVREIRTRHSALVNALSEHFNVKPQVVRDIVNRKTWRHM